MITYYKHADGDQPHDHRHGFSDFAHAAGTVAHLANQAGVASTANPSSLKFWAKLEDDTPENRAELARRIGVLMAGDAHGLAGDIRVGWCAKWLAQYTASTVAEVASV